MTIRSSKQFSASGLRTVVVALAMSIAVSLSGCAGAFMPEGGSYKKEIPEALMASDLGATEVLAGASVDGLDRYVEVLIYLDRTSVSADDLMLTLSTAASLVDQAGASGLDVSFHDSEGGLLKVGDAKDEVNAVWAASTLAVDGGERLIIGHYDTEVVVDLGRLQQFLDLPENERWQRG